MSGQGSRAASALYLLPLFTLVRGIGILGSSLAGSWIKPRNTPGSPSPDTPHSPGPLELVTPMDRYAGLWMYVCCKLMFAVTEFLARQHFSLLSILAH